MNLRLQSIRTTPLSDEALTAALGQEVSGSNRVMVTPDSYASILRGFPDAVSNFVFVHIDLALSHLQKISSRRLWTHLGDIMKKLYKWKLNYWIELKIFGQKVWESGYIQTSYAICCRWHLKTLWKKDLLLKLSNFLFFSRQCF